MGRGERENGWCMQEEEGAHERARGRVSEWARREDTRKRGTGRKKRSERKHKGAFLC